VSWDQKEQEKFKRKIRFSSAEYYMEIREKRDNRGA
jgi:hypothetical protein